MEKLFVQTPVRFLIVMFFLLLFSSPLSAGMGIGTGSPDDSAEAEFSSTSKGILIPRMTLTERDNISFPAEGLLIYQTNNTPGFYYYDGSAWQQLGGGSSVTVPTLSYTNAAGPIAVFPPLNTEITVVSVTQSVISGNSLKLDCSMSLDFATTASWSTTTEIRFYRDATLIKTDTINYGGSTAGTHSFPFAASYVDTAPATSASTTYSVRSIVTAATNITSSATGANIILNIVTFE